MTDYVPTLTEIEDAADEFRSGGFGSVTTNVVDKEKQTKYAVSTSDIGERRYVDERGDWWIAIANAKLFKTKTEATVAARALGGEPVRVTINYVAEKLE